MKRTNERHVGLDSQCLSYLLDAISGISEPIDVLAGEKKALLRSWFYKPGTFILTETVTSETSRIRNIDRRNFHESFISTLFLEYPVQNLDVSEKTFQRLRYNEAHETIGLLGQPRYSKGYKSCHCATPHKPIECPIMVALVRKSNILVR